MKQESIELYGSVKRPEGIVTAPYLRFTDGDRSCRIAIEVYEHYSKMGLSQQEILDNHADWYAASSHEYRKSYYHELGLRNTRIKKKLDELGLDDKEIVEGYIGELKKRLREIHAKSKERTKTTGSAARQSL